MTAGDVLDRPAFQSVDQEVDDERVSRLAIVSLMPAVISLLAPMANFFLLFSILAMVIGAIASIRVALSRELTGQRVANIALGLGIATMLWAYFGGRGRSDYLYATAGENAKIFLETVADGRVAEAYELTQMEVDRKITGTDLDAFYATAELEVKDPYDKFVAQSITQSIVEQGREAKLNGKPLQYEFVEGISITGNPKVYEVEVAMRDVSNKSAPPIHVILRRRMDLLVVDEGPPTAHWNVKDYNVP